MRTCVDATLKAQPHTSRHYSMAQRRPPIGQDRRVLRSGAASTTPPSRDSSNEIQYEDEHDYETEENSPIQSHHTYSELRQRTATLLQEENLNPNPALGQNTKHTVPKSAPECSTLQFVLTVVVLVLVAIAIAIFCVYSPSSDKHEDSEGKKQWLRENWASNIRLIRDKFPSQKKNMWSDFYSGIQKVLLEDPTEPSIFLLLHRGTEATSSCLAQKVGEVAHNYLNASSSHPLLLDGQALRSDAAMMEDYGLLIETYRPLVEEHRIMILNNLELVPAMIARGLHIFCDTVTPLVRKAVYIFTLNIDKEGNMEGNPTKIAEAELNTAWKQLDNDIRSALITRITSGSVFRIEPEEGMRNVC